MVYVLVNTFMAIPGDSVGTVPSCHRTDETALKAMAKVQRHVRKYSGKNAYLPMAIYKLAKRPKYHHIGLDEITPTN